MAVQSLFYINNIRRNEADYTIDFSIDANHEVFRGHFPDQPVVPGVCQVQLIREVLEEVLQKPLVLHAANNMKFMNMIVPERSPELQLQLQVKEEDEVWKVKASITDGETIFLKFQGRFQEKKAI